jgi:hypothetical protein
MPTRPHGRLDRRGTPSSKIYQNKSARISILRRGGASGGE